MYNAPLGSSICRRQRTQGWFASHYNYSIASPPSFNPAKLPELIEKTHHRLTRVQIENRPYEVILEKLTERRASSISIRLLGPKAL